MILDITGIELTPGKCGDNCLGNGNRLNEIGQRIECCCDECAYMVCCQESHCEDECLSCNDEFCPRSKRHQPLD